MWTREELKNNAKRTMSTNYWVFVLAAVVILFLGANTLDFNINLDVNKGLLFSLEGVNIIGDGVNDTTSTAGIYDVAGNMATGGWVQWILGSIFAGLAALVALASVAIKAFVCGPIEVGVNSTFLKGQHEKAESGDILSGFTGGAYMNVVLVQFLRLLFTALWSLLFVIPGIIKAYEYRMIPYLLAENPGMDRKSAFATSKEIMMGQKMEAFVLDLSFILWRILSVITFGIVGIFYVNPYMNSTNAQLYITLKRDVQ